MPFTEINGKTLFYSWKPASRAGLTLYFIHGLGSAHSFWSPVIPDLVDAGFSCLAIDVPGFGQSPYHGKPHTLEEIADDCITLLESLGKSLDRTIIIGSSMAGIVCCEIAVKHQVAGVVSVGPICPGPETKEAFEHRVAVIEQDGLEGIVNSVDIPTRATGSKATRTAEAFVRSLIQSSNADAYKSLSQAIADAPVPQYNKITCPLLCVAGQEDQVARLEDLALIGDEHLEVLFGVGHWHCIEDAEGMEGCLRRFAKKVESKLRAY
ncbi:putative alpha/beta hydrolase [Cryphonectria parasitica EP155]|uniref:Alpha/beta hydrolase n=1 Tax=Cryphonectria parasitica (strain ATCC 38755 / EP155) TaxID=660469 RepID=A0A9P5CNG7_CRYP1|nr:putative alpha/beta hydrolase [Cryphonectria parasitica EP155]KAF3763895.1 putative alpha/beta hydrolase [Cryphonectria parasitica EP155]